MNFYLMIVGPGQFGPSTPLRPPPPLLKILQDWAYYPGPPPTEHNPSLGLGLTTRKGRNIGLLNILVHKFLGLLKFLIGLNKLNFLKE